jgi:hypothetical protein
MTDAKTVRQSAFAAAVLTWIAGLIAAATCFGLPFAVALVTAIGAEALASEHALLIPIFEVMLLIAAGSAVLLARRTGRQRAYGYVAVAVLLAGAGIFLHLALVFSGLGLLALVTARLVGHARTAGIC